MKHNEYDIIREEIKKASESNQLVVFVGAVKLYAFNKE